MANVDSYPNAFLRRRTETAAPVLAAWAVLGALFSMLAGGPTRAAGQSDRPAAGRVPAVVTEATESRLVFRVDLAGHEMEPGRVTGTVQMTIPGFVRRGEAGEPATLTRQFLVALPPSGDYSVDGRVIESRPLGVQRLEPNPFPDGVRDDDMGVVTSERYELDPAIYNAYRSPRLVEARAPVHIRRQRALPVWVNPVTFDPLSGEVVLATSIEISVTFRAGAIRATGPRTPESPMWDSVFPRLFVNPGQAREWRLEPRFQAGDASRSASTFASGGQVKIKVYETGIHSATAATLIAAGFPGGQNVSGLHLFRCTYNDNTLQAGVQDVAIAVEEDVAGVMGEFEGNDRLVFFGRALRDDPAQDDVIRKYSDYNVYWLAATSGPAMGTRSVSPGYVTADTAVASFTTAKRVEEDRYFREETPPPLVDFYSYNFGTEDGPIDLPFEVGAVQPGTNLSLVADLNGDRYSGEQRVIVLSLVNSLGTKVINPALTINGRTRLNYNMSIPAADVVEGTNTFRFARPNPPGRADIEVILNWLDVSYQARYRARDNTLRFNTALLSGDTTVTVTGLSDTDVWLFDVTQPDAPVILSLDAGHFVPIGAGFALSFRENIPARREFVLIPDGQMIEVAAVDVETDSPSAIIGSAAESGVDILVVSHDMFLARMQEWVRYRRAQGYRVLMADVADVYDEFNNGVPHTRAIDRFVRHFYEMGGAGALVLVGDSSEDAKFVEPLSAPNFVPTHSWPDHVSVILEDEIVTTDKRFVLLPGPGGAVDAYPDLIVGRLPVGSDIEIQRVLAKIFAYEKPAADDFWRKRMIIVADDAYSEGNSTFGGRQLCRQGNEVPFQTGQERFARVIERSLPAGYDVIRFFLTDYTTDIHQENCVPKQAAEEYVRTNVTPLIMGELDQGATLVAIQSHMNRTLVTHEKLLTTDSGSLLPGGLGRDHLRLKNSGKPFIVFGMGCHFSDYALHKELSQGRLTANRPNGDAFAEQLLLANNTGAVATYGSTGFEYLGQTNAFMDMVSWVWFYEAPYDTMINQTQGEWVFGELMFLVENRMAGFQSAPVQRYHILGDPMLRIDAGPPAFDVTVNGQPFESSEVVGSGGEGDTIRVRAIVTDENVIHEFKLTIDNEDRTDDLTRTRLVDPQLDHARQYELSFAHKLEPKSYDIVLNAFQAPDTTSGQFHMAAQFVLRVQSSVTLTVNGTVVESGSIVPPRGDYRVELALPVFVPADSVSASIDGDVVADALLSHPAPEDSTTWIIRFTRTLSRGKHELVVRTGAFNEFRYSLRVSGEVGLRNFVAYPNPFIDTVHFLYSNDVEISDGTIDIFTVSGKRIRRIEIPPDARPATAGNNSVFWDGRDQAGGRIANGVYLYLVSVTQRGKSTTTQGKIARIE